MASRFEKFSERARRVLSLAQEEAQRFNHNYIGTEHILLGLVRETDGVAARIERGDRAGADAGQIVIGHHQGGLAPKADDFETGFDRTVKMSARAEGQRHRRPLRLDQQAVDR